MSHRAERVFMWVPLPPPFAGPEVASQLLVEECRQLKPDIVIENATLRRSNSARGRLDLAGAMAFLRSYPRFLCGAATADVVYMVAVASVSGCLRDAVQIASARVLGKRLVLHMRGGRYDQFYEESHPLLQRVLRFAWASADKAIVQTPGLTRVLREAAPDVKIEVLPNGLPAEQFPPKVEYAKNARRILFVGHLSFAKGFYDLMQAFRRIRARRPDVTLVCAGEFLGDGLHVAEFLPDGTKQEYLRHRQAICREIRSFVEADDGVEYVGVVTGDAKRELFTSADVFVLPSYAEGFSLAVLEAMFHGLPVIASTAGGLPDIIRDGANGLILPPGDIDRLVSALDRLLGDAAMCEQIGRRNAHEARERYEIRSVAARLTSILDDI